MISKGQCLVYDGAGGVAVQLALGLDTTHENVKLCYVVFKCALENGLIAELWNETEKRWREFVPLPALQAKVFAESK